MKYNDIGTPYNGKRAFRYDGTRAAVTSPKPRTHGPTRPYPKRDRRRDPGRDNR